MRFFTCTGKSSYPQSCSVTEIEGGCTCSQVSPLSAACCKKFNSINILQHCPSDFVAEPTSGHMHVTFWSHNPCNIKKNCLTSTVKMSHMQPRLARLFYFEIHRSIRIYIPLTFFSLDFLKHSRFKVYMPYS